MVEGPGWGVGHFGDGVGGKGMDARFGLGVAEEARGNEDPTAVG